MKNLFTNNSKSLQRGQSLITLLFFMVIGVTVISASALIMTSSILSGSTQQQGTAAYYVAESGVEDAILHLLRNPSYTGGTVPVGLDQATVTVSTSRNTSTITSIGTSGSTVRKIQVVMTVNNGAYSVSSWQEIN